MNSLLLGVCRVFLFSLLFANANLLGSDFSHGSQAKLNELEINGTVTDENQQAMPGVNILIKGTSIGTTSDINGNFSLSLPDAKSVLVFQFIGYKTQEIEITDHTQINVSLKPDIIVHYPVVNMGYQLQPANEISGAVATIDSRNLFTPFTNFAQALQGRLAGVMVGNDNSPGGEAMIRIRGFSSPVDSSPLVVIDGVAVSGNFSTLNPNDIEDIAVLKDGSSTGVYGSRGANGVIVITTKKGRFGKPTVSYDMYYGVSSHRQLPELLNTNQFGQLTWQSRMNSNVVGPNGNPIHAQFGNGTLPVVPDYIFPSGTFEGDPRVAQNVSGNYVNYSADIDGADFNKTKWLITKANKQGTDWLDEIFNSGSLQNHQIGISGGSESGQYAVSLNYFDEQGIMNNTNFKRYSMRVNTKFNVNQHVRIGENIQIAYGGRVAQPNGNSSDNNPIINAYCMQPIVPVYDVAGNFAGSRGTDLGNAVNPVAQLWRNKDNVQKEVRLFGNTFLEVDIVKNLTARSSLGIDYSNANDRQFTFRDIESAEALGSNRLRTSNSVEWMLTWYNILSYDVWISENHRVQALLGAETIKNRFETFSASRTNFYNDDPDNRYLSGGTGAQQNEGGGSSRKLRSQFIKVNYAFADKYFVEGTAQREKLSLFPGNKTPTINLALSAGWKISSEPFAEVVDTWLDDLRMRGGWGKNSNQTNIGLDAQLFNRQLGISLDAYTRNSKTFRAYGGYYMGNGWVELPRDGDSLFIPPPTIMWEDLGTIVNKGIELQLNYYGTAIASDLRFSVGFNFSLYRNNVQPDGQNLQYLGFNSEQIQNFVVTQSGHPISSYFGYIVDGVFGSDADAQVAPLNMLGINQNRAGRFQYRDVNSDGIINTQDLTVIGNPHPDFTYGLSVDISYRNFGLTLFGHGVYGNDIFNYVKYWTDFPTFVGNRSVRMLENSWQPDRTKASLPKLEASDQVSTLPSSYYIENGSYFRMKNIQLSYFVPRHIMSKVGLASARVFIQTENIFTITRYSGLEPEVNLRGYTGGGDRQFGVDGGIYPAAKQYLIGVNLKF